MGLLLRQEGLLVDEFLLGSYLEQPDKNPTLTGGFIHVLPFHDIKGEALEEVRLEPPVDVLLAEVALTASLLTGYHQLIHVVTEELHSTTCKKGDKF